MEEIKLPPPERAAKTAIGAGSSGKGTVGSYLKADALFSEKAGKKLDYGSGRGEGAKSIKADTYEPYVKSKPKYDDAKKIPSASYNKVTSLNVLNVLPPEDRNKAVKNIGRILTPNGEAIISTRGVKDVESAKNKVKIKDGYIIGKGDDARFQKGFTATELKNYVQKTLGKSFVVENVKGIGKAAIKIKKLNIPKGLGGVTRQEGTPVINIQEKLLFNPRQNFSSGGDVMENEMLSLSELEMFRKENDYYHDTDPRNPMNTEGKDLANPEVQKNIAKQLEDRKKLDVISDMPISRKAGKRIKEKRLEESLEKGKALNINKGGSISKQMELFSEGGLKQEGGSVDPVSGNDVPVGSTKEEVRDDIPARLSEGEFVMPADVVRFHGLDKMMELRDQAKMGLKKMEAMGQMGNADEATLPDDVPFGMDDLDIEDEPKEMAEGGVVQAANGTFMSPNTGIGGFQQSQFANYTPQFTPYMPTQLPTTSYIAPQQQTTPLASQQTLPKFEDVIPAPEGKYDEIIEYENEEGLKLSIPFVNGKPIFPIPKGYKKVDKGLVKPEPAPVTSLTPKVTRTIGEGDDGFKSGQTQADKDRMSQISARTARAKELGYTPANPVTSVLGMLTPLGMLGVGKTPGTIDMAGNVIGQDKRSYDPTTGKAVSSGNIFSDITNAITGKDISNMTPVTDEKGVTSMVEIGKGAQELGVTAMTAGGMKQYTIDEMRGFLNDAQKDLNVAKAEVSRATAGSKSNQFGLGAPPDDSFSKGRDDYGIGQLGEYGGTSTSIGAPDDDVENISDDVETDAKGNADRGPNSHGFDAYGSGVADRQGTVTGIDNSGAISYSPEHDWGQPTQTTVDDKSFGGPGNTSSGNPASNPADMGLGSISTDNPGGEASDSCFIKGTKIKLYEGGTIAIEKLKKGNVILGIHGTPNTVLGMDIHKVNKHNRPELVKIEGYDKPFITASHPFYKDNLLMSFNNKLNSQYHPWLGKVKDAKEHFKYKKVLAKDNEMLYNLYLDGDHTHYANNLPVHNIVRNGHISFALLYKNYITQKQYEGDIEYVKGIKNRLVRLGYSKIAYPLAYEIMNDTKLGRLVAKLTTPIIKKMAESYEQKKTFKLLKGIQYLVGYPTFYLRGLIGR